MSRNVEAFGPGEAADTGLRVLRGQDASGGTPSPTRVTVAIPDLGIGNMASVANMVRKCGGIAEIVPTPERLRDTRLVILAGVGSFDAGMKSMTGNGWSEPLEGLARSRVPILGICLGMQMMCRSSEEGSLPGLGWIDAEVKRIRPPEGTGLKVPHMGWNTVQVAKPNPLLEAGAGEQRFYFVHSYHAVCRDPGDLLATARHGQEVTAAFSRGSLYGVQFHPEKSHRFGMALIKRFIQHPC